MTNRLFHKNRFFTILNGIWEVWGCPGGAHGLYEAIPSNFGGIWSYMAWGKSIFMFLGNIGKSLHHQIPSNRPSGLQIDPRIFLKARAPSQETKTINFPGNYPKQNIFREPAQPPKIIIFRQNGY